MLGLMVLTMFTVMIFQSIAIDMEWFVENYLLVYGGCAVAVLTVYLVEAKKSIVENFAPCWQRSSARCSVSRSPLSW